MKFIIKKRIFDEAVELVSRYTDLINVSYGLRCILFEVTEEKITMKASDGFVNIIKSLDVNEEQINVVEEGSFLINASLFKNSVKKMSGDITITDETGQIQISCSELKYNLAPSPINIFQGFEEIYGEKKIEISTSIFKDAVKSVGFAVSNEDYTLKCINFNFHDSTIDVTATDRYRLARYSIKTNTLFDKQFDISVLASSVKELIPAGCPEKAILFFNNTKFGIEYKNTKITARITDVTYPKIDHLFDTTEIKHVVKIKKETLVDLLNKAFVITIPGYKKVNLHFNKSELKVSTIIPEIGQSLAISHEIEYEGQKNLSLDVDYNYIKDALNVYSDEVVLLMDEKPSKILIFSKSKENAKQILSPTRG
ncbi:DNA polymerase III subunit beta [Mycoplasmopsis iners]|uniref:DNA polymerase III subunit beta n=1 Tax=Mycoplasmopsis iners TaxID=76630 RepID=UPI0004965DD1|nr:DNA polymerase III subunit beta [Mycoplasmopsis iners]